MKDWNYLITQLQNNAPSLRIINYAHLHPDYLKEIIDALAGTNQLTSLSLVDCYHNLAGSIDNIANIIKTNTRLETLNLFGGFLGHLLARNCLPKLTAAIQYNQSINKLILGYNQINDYNIKFIADLITDNHSLTYLALGSNYIGFEGASIIGRALKVNSTLQELSLDCPMYAYGICDKGATSLAEALKINTGLRKLSLAYNGIGTAGLASLGEALKINCTLTSLDLTGNIINSEGILSIAKALETNHQLKELNLWHQNQLTHEDHKQLKMIADYLARNNQLNKESSLEKQYQQSRQITFFNQDAPPNMTDETGRPVTQNKVTPLL